MNEPTDRPFEMSNADYELVREKLQEARTRIENLDQLTIALAEKVWRVESERDEWRDKYEALQLKTGTRIVVTKAAIDAFHATLEAQTGHMPIERVPLNIEYTIAVMGDERLILRGSKEAGEAACSAFDRCRDAEEGLAACEKEIEALRGAMAPPEGSRRGHLVSSAGYWFMASRKAMERGGKENMAMAVSGMENAYNHVENALHAERDKSAEARKCVGHIASILADKRASDDSTIHAGNTAFISMERWAEEALALLSSSSERRASEPSQPE